MMTPALAALCLMAPLHSAGQSGLHWPMVGNTLFVVNGIDANGTAQLAHVKVTERHGVKEIGKATFDTSGTSATVAMPPATTPWKTLQVVFSYTADGVLAKFGGLDLAVRNGSLWFIKDGFLMKIAPLKPGDLNDVQILNHFESVLVYVNGSKQDRSVLPTKALVPIEVGLEPFKGTIIGMAAYTRELSSDELFVNDKAAQSMAKALFADTAKVTVEGELTAVTPVPELERIRPYRSALLAEEYKVVRIVSGRMSAIKPGMKIRIFRYGIKAGEKTVVKDAKIGDHHELLIQPYDSDVKFSREFQVDTLDPDISIPLYVDVTPEK